MTRIHRPCPVMLSWKLVRVALLGLAVIVTQAQARPARLLLVHPTRAYLENVTTLVVRKILAPAGGIEIVGVYHELEKSCYEPALQLIAESGYSSWVSLVKLEGALRPDEIWRPNHLTGTLRTLFDRSDGAIFTGGPDIPAYLYGQRTSLLASVEDPQRHFWELSFMHLLVGGRSGSSVRPWLAERPAYPILAICLGLQTLNVAAGGTLVQDVPSLIYGCSTVEQVEALPEESRHRDYSPQLGPRPRSRPGWLHSILFTGPWPFAVESGLYGRPTVLSLHHQAVEAPGAGLRIVATSVDGKVPEAMRHTRFDRVLGVQFHPEWPGIFEPARRLATPAGKPAVDGDPLLSQSRGFDARSVAFHRDLYRWLARCLEEQARTDRNGGTATPPRPDQVEEPARPAR
ncbi:MAG: gamma-glutamyl-gamma-aminobutyrate hydrolase family protein [Candidatus Riflebacteria bacterium]|nr:gamma-glutamyl-gamma-aminobutyrate hydrolase family protein [Candidatus Riflebacteria bacterium]